MRVSRGGRRPGKNDTRTQILEAAKRAFSENGYDAATVRDIAGAAGVDAAMIHYHFGNKEQLFMATLEFPLTPGSLRDLTDPIMTGPNEEIAARLLKQLLTVWDSPLGSAAVALLRTAVQHQWCARLLREFLLGRIIGPVFNKLGTDKASAQWRASLVASQMTGLVLTRYILKVEPLASAPQDAIIAALAPTIQRYIDGDLQETPQS